MAEELAQRDARQAAAIARERARIARGALAYLLGINVLRASEAAGVKIEDYADTLRLPGAAPGWQRQQAPPRCR